jgi:hypothetical protein
MAPPRELYRERANPGTQEPAGTKREVRE